MEGLHEARNGFLTCSRDDSEPGNGWEKVEARKGVGEDTELGTESRGRT